MATPRIIALATLKPGSGKSTLAACLAAHWRAREEAVALIDADRGTKSKWTEEDGPLARFAVTLDPGQRLGDLVHALARRHRPVLIDTSPAADATTTEALGVVDLAVVPMQPSPVDIKAGLETRRLVDEINRSATRSGRPVKIRFLLTSAEADSALALSIRAELDGAGLGLLSATMTRRPEYSNAAFSGATPVTTHPDGIAAREIAAIAREIENTPVAGAG
jgi:chromosome partitioning protein